MSLPVCGVHMTLCVWGLWLANTVVAIPPSPACPSHPHPPPSPVLFATFAPSFLPSASCPLPNNLPRQVVPLHAIQHYNPPAPPSWQALPFPRWPACRPLNLPPPPVHLYLFVGAHVFLKCQGGEVGRTGLGLQCTAQHSTNIPSSLFFWSLKGIFVHSQYHRWSPQQGRQPPSIRHTHAQTYTPSPPLQLHPPRPQPSPPLPPKHPPCPGSYPPAAAASC